MNLFKILFFLFSLCPNINGQIKIYSKIIAGTETSGYIQTVGNEFENIPSIYLFTFLPHLDFKVIENLYIGGTYEIHFGKSGDEKIPNFQSIGFQTKYYFYPFNSNYKWSKLFFNTEIGFKKSNYYIDRTHEYGLKYIGKFDTEYFDLIASSNLQVFERTYINIGYRWVYFPFNQSQLKGPRLALSYHFGEKREPKPQKISLTNDNSLKKNPHQMKLKFANGLIYSTSFTYIPFSESISYDDKYNIYHMSTWANSIVLNLNKYLYFGLEHLSLWTSGSAYNDQNSKDQYYLYGFKLQYDFVPNYLDMLFVESSINFGNFCMCGSKDPYKQDDLVYFGLGAGYDYPFSKMIALRIGLKNYFILNNIEKRNNIFQYILGLTIKLNREENRPRYDWNRVLFKR